MLRQGSSGAAVRALQDQLRAAGFDPGPSDGMFGAQTNAALRPGPAPGPAPSAGDALVNQRYPQFAWALSIPEVGNLLRQATTEGWTPDRLQAGLYATTWWKATQASERQWLNLMATDPASSIAQRNQEAARINEQVSQMGLALNTDQIGMLADQYLRYGWNDQQLLAHLSASLTYQPGGGTGMLGSTNQQVRQLAGEYLVPISDEVSQYWSRRILSGMDTIDSFKSYIAGIAKSMFPSMASVIDQGITPSAYADPYRQLAAKDLEIDPYDVDFLNPKWRTALDQVGAGGNRTPMSLSDWERKIKTDPVYGYDTTKGARSQAADFATKLGQMFGAVG